MKKNEDSINVLEDEIAALNVMSEQKQQFDFVLVLEFDKLIQPITKGNFRDSQLGHRAIYMLCARARDNLFLIYGPNPLPTSYVIVCRALLY